MVIIENLESLKTWLVKKLTPMCDADPNALAKYVVALVRKDKSEEDLRKLCIDQLEVFLQARTSNFVIELFDILKSKDYGGDAAESPNADKDETQETKELSKRPKRRTLNRPSPIRHRSRSPYDRRRRTKRSRSPRDRRHRYRSHSGSPKRGRLSPKRRSPVRRSHSRSPYRRSRRARSLSSSRSRSSSHDSSPKGNEKKKKRCWDFDQKGFCVLGDNCPYDHGKDPVVLEEATMSSVNRPALPPSKINPITAPPPLLPPVKPNVPPPVLPPPPFLPPPVGIPVPPPGLRLPLPPPVPPPPGTIRIPPPGVLPLPPRSQPPPGYNPEAPGLNYGSSQTVSSAPPMIPGLQGRPIITAPPPIPPPAIRQNLYATAAPTFNQNSGPRNNYNPNNSKLVIRKIPPALNNIAKLHEHFGRFGAINNIQVKFENDAQSALVEYAHVNSARAAKRDTGAVMNNRFITVYWYNGPNVSNGSTMQSFNRGSVKERLGTIPKPSQLKYTAPSKDVTVTPAPAAEATTVEESGNIFRTITNKPASQKSEAKPANEAVNTEKERLETKNKVQKAQQATKEKLMARQKVMLLKKIELQKQKRQLLEAQMAKQRLLLKKIKECTSPTQKQKLLESLKTLIRSIDKLRNSLKGEITYDPLEAKEKQQKAQKDVLDAELDLYNATSAGESTSNLKRKLSQLKMEASSLGLTNSYKPGWGRGRGRGSYVPRPKVPRIFSATANLDRRPRELRISGFHEDEKDEVISHLARFGEIEQFSFGDDDITCTVKFQTRSQADAASSHGVFFKNRRLVIVWTSSVTNAVSVANTATATTESSNVEENKVVPPEELPLIVSDDKQNAEDGDDDDDDDASDNVNVHIGDVTVGYIGEIDDVEDDNFGDELDEDALLEADFDEDVGDDPDFEDEELRSWRH